MKIFFYFIIFLTPTYLYSQILTTSQLPIVIIETGNNEIPDEPKIKATMGIIDNGTGNLNHIQDAFNHFSGHIGIETRGNSTQDFDKKTYSIELRTSSNEDTSLSLLGMGEEEDWILHAMVIDKTQLRIPMSFQLFREMGHYASDWRFVELVIDGDYRGLYLLCERIKRDKNRVDIAKLKADDISGDELTGGYILRIDWLEEEAKGFSSNYQSQGEMEMFYQWYYPKAENIQPEQETYIKGFMDEFEEAVFANNYSNSMSKRYTEYIDVQSFIDFLLINELSKNADGYKLSSYLHKEKDSDGGKLKAGPIWDFDQTYGVSLVCSNHNYEGWTFLQNQDGCEDLESMPMWWQAMVRDSIFSTLMKNRWTELRASFLNEANLMQWIDDQRSFIQPAIDRNFTRWDEMIGDYIWIEPEPVPETYVDEITYLKDWIQNRLIWMDNHISSIDKVRGEGLHRLNIYPNPAQNYFYLEGNMDNDIRIFNVNNELVYHQIATNDRFQINIPHLVSGVYFVHVNSEEAEFEITKLVILRN